LSKKKTAGLMEAKRIMKKTRSRKKIICFLFAKSIFYSIFAVTKKDYWNMKNLETRTSIRKYAQREVSNQLLHRLLSQAERTQTMGNLQLYSVVITRSEAQKAALAPAHFNQPMVTSAPVVLTFCADFRRTTTWAQCRKGTPGYDNLLSFLNAATDALRAMERGDFVRAQSILVRAQRAAESRYLEETED
jgi:nitroreductase